MKGMLRTLMSRMLERRAAALVGRLAPWIEPGGRVLDIGSGTGHNAAALMALRGCAVRQVDVADISVAGPPPLLFNGRDLPFADGQYETGLMLFVLQYVMDPAALLGEAHRVLSRRLIVIQSTWQSRAALAMLRLREWPEGRLGLWIARWSGLVQLGACSLRPQTYWDRERLEALFACTGWAVRQRLPEAWPGVKLSRDLYVLEKNR